MTQYQPIPQYPPMAQNTSKAPENELKYKPSSELILELKTESHSRQNFSFRLFRHAFSIQELTVKSVILTGKTIQGVQMEALDK